MTDMTVQDSENHGVMPEIPLYRDRLSNGLTLLVHENPDAENISLHIAYGVGAKDEPTGMFGFAHLLEHLMFSGSQGLPGSYIQHLQQAGAQGLNGVTTADMTRFFQTVPEGSLDFALFAESDRMGYLTGALTSEALDVQRRVVIREMDENESQPYGKVQGALLRHLYPAEHPYAHKVAGEIADLQNTRFADAVRWIRRYYRPNNAVITLVGNITAAQAKEKVSDWFGQIPAGEPLEYRLSNIPDLRYPRKVIVEDVVDAHLIRLCWPLPGYNDDTSAAMEVFAGILANLESSRLIQRLMVENTIASDVSAFVEPGILCSVFNLRILLQPGADVSQAEEIIRDTLQQVLTHLPEATLLADSRQLLLSDTYAGLSEPLGLADAVGKHALMTRDESGIHQRINKALQFSAQQILDIARQWLGDGMLWLRVDPFTSQTSDTENTALRTPPAITLPAVRQLPVAEVFTLSNGLEVSLSLASAAERTALCLILPAGARGELLGEEGLAQLVCSLLAAGTSRYDTATLHQLLQHHEVYFDADVQPESSIIHLFMPAHSLPEVLPLLGSMVSEMQPTEEMLIAHRDYFCQMVTGRSLKEWALPAMIYPQGHPLRQPAFSQGYPESLHQVGISQVLEFYSRYYKPQGAKLLLNSALTRHEVKLLLEQTFSHWTGEAAEPRPLLPAPSEEGGVLLAPQPGRGVNSLSLYFILPARGSEYDAELQIIHSLLAGSFGSRINYSLREIHQLTYNVVAQQEDLPDCRLTGFECEISVSDTLTAASIIMDELRALSSTQPLTITELSQLARTEYYALNLPLSGDHESLLTREFLARAGLPNDYFSQVSQHMLDANLNQVRGLIEKYLHPSRARWLLSGEVAHLAVELETLTGLSVQLLPEKFSGLY